MARLLLHKMRLWDIRTSNSVDSYIANSNFVAQRIWKLYRRPAKVISPPVNVDRFRVGESKGDFYFTASRLVQYKRIDLIAEAFSRTPERRLVIAGEDRRCAASRRWPARTSRSSAMSIPTG